MACQLFLNICKEQWIIPLSFHIYNDAIQSCSSKPQLQNGSMNAGQGQDLFWMNQENYRKTSVNIFSHWIAILIPESSKYKEGVLKSDHVLFIIWISNHCTKWVLLWKHVLTHCLHLSSPSGVSFTVILSNFGLLGYISKTWSKGLTSSLLAANQSEEKSNAWLLWTVFTIVCYLGVSWNSGNVKEFTLNKQNNFISFSMSITISKKSSVFIPVGLRMRRTLKSVLCTNNNDLIATFANDILGNWWCRSVLQSKTTWDQWISLFSL